MTYQLVLQFPEESSDDLAWIVDMEDQLEVALCNAEIDGHDIGSGEINIFIHTENPLATFEKARQVLKENAVLDRVKVAYRDLEEEHYVCLWPAGLTNFNII